MKNLPETLRHLPSPVSGERAYKNYVIAQEAVLNILKNAASMVEPSNYWQEELSGMDYMLEASPLVIDKLRHHCYHLTGQRPYDYRKHHEAWRGSFLKKLRALQAQDAQKMLVPEPRELGGFGYEIDGNLYNQDTLRYYETLLAIQGGGLLDFMRKTNGRPSVLEIGGGWGGLTYQLKTLFPKATYILVDFPQTLIFCGTYLPTLFPDSRLFFVENRESFRQIDPDKQDFIFVPHFLFSELSFRRPDLVINMESFQEMTTPQVDSYIKKAHEWGVPHIYSMNRDCSPYNKELTSVNDILGRYYNLKEVKLNLENPSKILRKTLKSSIVWLLSGERALTRTLPYRHLIGHLPQ